MKRLRLLLSRTRDGEFLQLAWAVNALQARHPPDLRRHLIYPQAAANATVGSLYKIFPWEVENLVLLRLATPDRHARSDQPNFADCTRFETFSDAVNYLRSIENAASGQSLNGGSIFNEMHRIGHRQFGWQRGYGTTERLYRYNFVYGQGDCGEAFRVKHGLTVEQFQQIAFLLYAQSHANPWIKIDFSRCGVDRVTTQKAMALLARSLMQSKTAARCQVSIGDLSPSNFAYPRSSLRRYPLIELPQYRSYIAPLPELLFLRATSGLFYDVCADNQTLTGDANSRFEAYVSHLVEAMRSRFQPVPAERIVVSKKNTFDTPDVLLKDFDEVVLAIECKATKLTYDAQFSLNPIEDASSAYCQLVKAVVQLWKFFSRVRRGHYQTNRVARNVQGVVLTLDSWMPAGIRLLEEVVSRAREQVRDNVNIDEQDMRPIVFCSIQDLNDLFYISNDDEFLATIHKSASQEFLGWNIVQVRKQLGPNSLRPMDPFKFQKVFPWWEQTLSALKAA